MIAFEKSVGGIIFRKTPEGLKYLLLHYASGHWDFPKGHVEKGETDEETLRREVKEETNFKDLKIIPGFSEKFRYFYKAKGDEYKRRKEKGKKTLISKGVTFYLAETSEGEVKISYEHIGFEWLPYDKALERVTYKNPKKVLEKANRFIAKSKI
jgi:bis(5'-nucleosidyl)-tetraphosphatase